MVEKLSEAAKQEGKMGLVDKIAEVIESSSSAFTAQCYKLGQAPPLGALVKTRNESGETYGIVYNVETRSLDPGRRVVARGEELEQEDEIFLTNPQLAKLLTTDFNVLVAGYHQGDSVYYYLPPSPVPIHSFVYICKLEEVELFTRSMDFLGLLIDTRLPVPADEVTTAFLRYASRCHADSYNFLIKAGKELAWLLSGDFKRLNSVLKRLR